MTDIPEGYLQNATGHLVPIEKIKPMELARNDLVKEIVSKALELRQSMSTFKTEVMGDIDAFVDLVAERYDVNLGGKKGNLSLLSYDGQHKVMISVSDQLHFGEEILAAKSLVDECIHEWTENSDTKVKALVEHAFQTDKEGKINVARVLGLMKLDIDDQKWKKAMEALKDSVQVASSSIYLRVYERVGQTKQYKQVALDMAGL